MTRIEIDRKNLIKVLTTGGTFAGRSKALPILDCVKIKVSDGNFTVVSTDNENAISNKTVTVSSDGDTVFCVNLKDFLSYVKLIKGDNAVLEVGDTMMDIRHSNGEMSMPVISADEYPSFNCGDSTVEFEYDSATLNNWIVDARNFTADDELRPQMNDIYLYCNSGELGCCASDGHYMFTDNTMQGEIDFSFLLNRNAFKAACDVCHSSDKVKVKICSNNVLLSGDCISLICRMNESRYPNFKSVIPTNQPIQVKLPKSELVDSINRVRIAGSNVTSLLKVEVDGMNMKISAEDIDFNRKAVETLMVEADGNITIGLHAGKLLTCLSAISTDYVVMGFSEQSKPCVMKEDDENSKKIVLLMPMMLND